MRVTLGMLTGQIRTNLNNNTAAMLDAQDRLSSGKRIRKPSDDIPGTARSLSLRSSISSVEQFSRNSEFAKDQLSITSSALDQAANAMKRARDKALLAANSATTPESRAGIATEIQTISDELLGIANTQYLGRYIFAGSKSDTKPVDTNAAKATAHNLRFRLLRLHICRPQ